MKASNQRIPDLFYGSKTSLTHVKFKKIQPHISETLLLTSLQQSHNKVSTFQARKKELMGKVSQAEHHVDLLQKEALGNLQLRMGEVGRSVTSLPSLYVCAKFLFC